MGIILDIVVALFLYFAITKGRKKGGAKSILELLSFVATIIATMLFKDTIIKFILDLPFVNDIIVWLSKAVPLPEEILTNPLIDINTTKIATDIITAIISVAGFVLTYFVVKFVFGLFIKVVDNIMSLPILKGINKLLGAILGGIKGIFIIWIILSILFILKDITFVSDINSAIADSYLTKWIYNNNFLFNLF